MKGVRQTLQILLAASVSGAARGEHVTYRDRGRMKQIGTRSQAGRAAKKDLRPSLDLRNFKHLLSWISEVISPSGSFLFWSSPPFNQNVYR